MVIERGEFIVLLSLKVERYLTNRNYFFLPSDTEDIGDKDSDIDEIPDDGLRKNMNQLATGVRKRT